MTVKLHLGCGNRYLPGYVHMDIDNSVPHLDFCGEIHNLHMFEDESVDEIYSCGVIGYYDEGEAVELFREWRRVLKKNGTLRISVVDFEKQVEVYLQTKKNLKSPGVLNPLYGVWPYKNTNNVSKKAYKKISYDYKTLKAALYRSGFSSYRRYNWKKFFPKGYDDYSAAYVPHMDLNGIHIMLNITCKKDVVK
jgi:predicted SAM-dependent methyltransferase